MRHHTEDLEVRDNATAGEATAPTNTRVALKQGASRPRRLARPRRRLYRLMAAVLAAFSMVFVTVGPASAASWEFYDGDSINTWDASGSHVYMQSQVNWFRTGGMPWDSVRSEVAKNSWITLNSAGCLWVKISYSYATATVSWPPSGGSNTVDDGWYRYCGSPGQGIYISGIQGGAGRTLYATTICLGYSYNATYELRRFTTCHKVYAGYN